MIAYPHITPNDLFTPTILYGNSDLVASFASMLGYSTNGSDPQPSQGTVLSACTEALEHLTLLATTAGLKDEETKRGIIEVLFVDEMAEKHFIASYR